MSAEITQKDFAEWKALVGETVENQRQLSEAVAGMQKTIETYTKTREALRARSAYDSKAAEALEALENPQGALRRGYNPRDLVRNALDERNRDLVRLGKDQYSSLVPRHQVGIATALKYVRSLKAAAGNYDLALASVKTNGDFTEVANFLEEARDAVRSSDPTRIQRTLGTTSLSAGGILVPIKLADELIGSLVEKAVMRALPGIKVVNLVGGNLEIPRITTGIQGSFVGENDAIDVETPVTGGQKLTSKKLRAMTPISRDWRDRVPMDVDAIFAEDGMRNLGAVWDLSALRGTGVNETLRGLDYYMDNTQTSNSFARSLDGSGNVTFRTIVADIAKMIRTVRQSNVDVANGSFIFSVRDYYAIMSLLSDQNFLFRQEMSEGRLFNHPAFMTSQLPTTLAGDGNGNGTNDKSLAYFVAADRIWIGEEKALSVDVVPYGAYTDGGTVKSGLARDEDVMVFKMLGDMALTLNGKECARMTSVDYGEADS